ncbi:MAG: pantoate--beta-alanine ligase [Thermodesulfovibrionales bacterium]|nr:pantoate--beta-alanine ligase [Thermodesulfovibrionales bacterium]
MLERISIPNVMQETSRKFILKAKKIGFVPTMGALHNGHISLVERAKNENDITVVSIFVNPLQFGQDEDFDKYPRVLEKDLEMLESVGTNILFVPQVKHMYPEGFLTTVKVRELSDKLCGAFRKGHFEGVTTVVCKLINIVKPTRIYFGQKDYQQMLIVKQMVNDLNIDVEVVSCRTIRESDGLAMSSRNVYLNHAERKSATILYKTLKHIESLILQDKISCRDVSKIMYKMLSDEPLVKEIQYADIYDVKTLERLDEFKDENLLAIALKIGDTRLIDNLIVERKK